MDRGQARPKRRQEEAPDVIIVDANILVSTVAGKHTRRVARESVTRGIVLAAPIAQAEEAAHVLEAKIGFEAGDARRLLGEVLQAIQPLEPEAYANLEDAARARLHIRAQSDWPVVAAALALDAAIWSNDRDFFGVGVAVWSTKNMALAEPIG
jgi:predicted nucleic acid-binding protein